MAYIGKSPTGSGVRQRYVYTATGGETSLSGADDNSKTLKFTDGEYIDVHLNGVLLVQGTDYGVGTANTISSLAALAANDVVEITVYDIYNVAKINSEAMRNRWYFTATGGETSIGTSQISNLVFPANAEIDVKLNGVTLQAGTDYNTTSANTVGGLSALTAGQVVEIVYYEKFVLGDTVSKASGGTFAGQVIADGGIDMNGKELVLDADADTSITADTDDRIDFRTGGNDRMHLTSGGNLGLGTSAPATAIHASKTSTASQRIRVQNGEGNVDFGTDANRALIWVSGNQKLRVDSGGELRINAEGGSVATVDVRQGSSKMWIACENEGTLSTFDSYNVTSITDEATGRFSVTINNNMNNANYALTGMNGGNANNSDRNMAVGQRSDMGTGSFHVHNGNDGGVSVDVPYAAVNVHGDLA